MADIKWIKLATNMHDDEKMKLMDAMPDRDTIHYVWIRLLIQAGRNNACGDIFLSDEISYTPKMLAILFSRPIEFIKLALKTLSRLGMIEITSDKVIRIVNWDKHQNIEGMDKVREQNRKRAENNREKKKQEKKSAKENLEEFYEDEVLEESNVTQTENNDTVTQQNKKEIENKNKIKNENREIDKENDKNRIIEDINSKTLTCEEGAINVSLFKKNNNIKSEQQAKGEDINIKTLELMQYHEKITGRVGGCDYVALRSAINIHGEKRVKMAMDIGFENNCQDIKYAIGVLKNWRRDGYPKDDVEVKKSEFRSIGKSNSKDKNEFAGFKPKEPRKLTDAERKRIEKALI